MVAARPDSGNMEGKRIGGGEKSIGRAHMLVTGQREGDEARRHNP
jgi:hypothetical protein